MNEEIFEIRTFHYDIVRHGFRQQINYDIQIPLPENSSHRDYFGHLCAQQNIPIFAHKEIGIALKKFIQEESSKLTAEFVEKSMRDKLAEYGNDSTKLSYEISNNSAAIFMPEFGNSKEKEQNFEDQFQQIMRQCSSIQLMHLIGEEAAMNEEMRMLVQARDFELDRLEKACESALAASIQIQQGELMNGSGSGEDNNNQLSLLNNEIRQIQLDYSRQIEALLARQKRDYRELVRKMLKNEQIIGPRMLTMNRSATGTFGRSFHEKMNGNESKSKIKKSISCDEKMNGSKNNGKKEAPAPNCSESFSIYIGSQLKTMHNARILACQNFIRDLCLSQTTDEEHGGGGHDDLLDGSKRLHLLMNIYGRELSAVVLPVGRDPRWHIKKRTEFARLCEHSAELHFDSLEAQLEKVAQNVQEANKNRRRKREMADLSQLSYSPPMDFYEFDEEMLQPGDVYLTRHSNLSAVQLVFHLVGDSALSEEEISSRHPCICGLRNIVRLCAKSAIRNISFPLLMVDKFNEELMTQNWCQSRAELIFKCLKGFLMEVCSSNSGAGGALGGGPAASNSLHFNINFALPSPIPRHLFHQIVDLFTSIYYLVPSLNA